MYKYILFYPIFAQNTVHLCTITICFAYVNFTNKLILLMKIKNLQKCKKPAISIRNSPPILYPKLQKQTPCKQQETGAI